MPHEIVIIDTEYTTWEGAMESSWAEDWQHREIVQIAAIKLDLDTGEETDHLDPMIKPKINPDLSDYFIALTGITQQDVDEKGIAYEEAQTKLFAFTADLPVSQIIAYGWDDLILVENCALYGIDYPYPDRWINMRDFMVGLDINHKKYYSGNLHELTDNPLEDDGHNALHDVRSIGEFLLHQIKEGRRDFVENMILAPQLAQTLKSKGQAI